MPKRRSSSFGLYGDWMRAGLEASQLLASSAEVIGYRSHLIARAMNGELPFTHSEFGRMWEEKMRAGIDANLALWEIANQGRGALPTTLTGWGETMLASQLEMLRAMTLPYHRRATANARRLRKN